MFIKKTVVLLIAAVFLFIMNTSAKAGTETMTDYTDYPIFMSNVVTPNALIILDNSLSMNCPAYWKESDGMGGSQNLVCGGIPSPTHFDEWYTHDPVNSPYYGLFDPLSQYSYATNTFTINGAGDWNGNFLNWLTMRRIDVTRKVLMGGEATPKAMLSPLATPNGLIGHTATKNYIYRKKITDAVRAANNLAPSCGAVVGADCYFAVNNGDFWMDDKSTDAELFVNANKVNVAINVTTEYEPGIIHQTQADIRLGLEFFNDKEGGYIDQYMKVPAMLTDSFVTNLQGKDPDTDTPLAEALYTAIGFVAQDPTQTTDGPRYFGAAAQSYTTGVNTKDPFYFDDLSQTVSCASFFIILISDGQPTEDGSLPAAIKGAYDGLPNGHLDDVAFYGHTTDLRPASGSSPLDGTQVIDLYTVFAFGSDATGKSVMKAAAMTGGFEDKNGDGTVKPADVDEYDVFINATGAGGSDGLPDNYFEAETGDLLKDALARIFTDILKKATSGTAISVLATSASGAGNIYQAYFLPETTIIDAGGSRDVSWTGYLLSLGIDANGSLRDSTDTCIKFYFDEALSETFIMTVPETNGVCDTSVAGSGGTSLTSFTNYVWDAGELLKDRDVTVVPRSLYTYIPGTGVIEFTEANVGTLSQYLHVTSHLTNSVTAPYSGNSTEVNLIKFINGEEITDWRGRTDDSGNVYKLGDIVHSTPAVVSDPVEAYGLLYQDATYTTFFNANKNRATVVYVGANDGMLHAFDGTSGKELWSYIPFNLLPHLKWMADPSYTHVNYVDLKTKISDVYIGGAWKTVLIGGMRMGGGEITDDSATSRTSAYFALDITTPGATPPTVLWEFTSADLGFSTSYPAVVKTGNKWYAVFGSGPKSSYKPDYEGIPDQAAKLFVIDIEDGSLDRTFTSGSTTSFFADPVAVDIDFISTTGTDYDVDAVYIGETYKSGTGWNSRMWRLVTFGIEDPLEWKMFNLFNPDSDQQIIAAPSLANDDNDQQWIYFGTGKYYSDADKTTTDAQNFYGMKDPCWNPDKSNYGWKTPVGSDPARGSCTAGSDISVGNPSPSVSKSDLIDTTDVVVEVGGSFQTAVSGMTTVDDLADKMISDSSLGGWYVRLTELGERSLNKPTVVGGLVLFTTFVPNSDVCGFSGDSFFNVLYYATGTAYKQGVIGCVSGDSDCSGAGAIVLSKSEDSATGMASSIAVHMGRETGARAYVQLSTGEASALDIDTPAGQTSGIISWRDL